MGKPKLVDREAAQRHLDADPKNSVRPEHWGGSSRNLLGWGEGIRFSLLVPAGTKLRKQLAAAEERAKRAEAERDDCWTIQQFRTEERDRLVKQLAERQCIVIESWPEYQAKVAECERLTKQLEGAVDGNIRLTKQHRDHVDRLTREREEAYRVNRETLKDRADWVDRATCLQDDLAEARANAPRFKVGDRCLALGKIGTVEIVSYRFRYGSREYAWVGDAEMQPAPAAPPLATAEERIAKALDWVDKWGQGNVGALRAILRGES